MATSVVTKFASKLERRDERARSTSPSVRAREERRADVGEQRQRQPLERSGDQPVRAPDLQGQDGERRSARSSSAIGIGTSRLIAGGDRADVGAGVDRVGDHQQAKTAG